MPAPRRSRTDLARIAELVKRHGSVTKAAQKERLPYSTVRHAHDAAKAMGITGRTPEDLDRALISQLMARGATVAQLAAAEHCTEREVRDVLRAAKARGVNLFQFGDVWSIEKKPPVGGIEVKPYVSAKDGSYLFGWIGDTHLCSKYAREDVLADAYRKFAAVGVDRVFHTGNWIDGEARFNKFDLEVHGMQRQVEYCVSTYPRAKGITTYAVTGDDHEGWYAQREGIDIGRLLETSMREAGRPDWVNLGYMEAYVPLRHAKTGMTSMLHVVHPGGGSAYAVSYTVQKIVEGYESGNKPAVLLAGHYHKLEFLSIRGVWVVQTGCTQDLTPFARKKKLRYEIGAGIMRLVQNPDTGAIEQAGVDVWHYFDRGYYDNQRWSHHGAVVLPRRL